VPTVDYVAVAVDDGCRGCVGWNRDPWWFNGQLRRLTAEVEAQRVTPLPYHDFAFSEPAVQEAFRLLKRGANLGKVLLRVGGVRPESTVACTDPMVGTEAGPRAIGAVDPRSTRGAERGTLVRLCLHSASHLAAVELNDPERFNTMSAALGEDMSLAVSYLRQRRDAIRALTLQGAGKVFCAGGNPYGSREASLSLPAIASNLVDSVHGFVCLRRLGASPCCPHGPHSRCGLLSRPSYR